MNPATLQHRDGAVKGNRRTVTHTTYDREQMNRAIFASHARQQTKIAYKMQRQKNKSITITPFAFYCTTVLNQLIIHGLVHGAFGADAKDLWFNLPVFIAHQK